MYHRATVMWVVMIALIVGACAQTNLSSTAANATVTLPPGITLPPTHAPFPTANIPALPSEYSDIPANVVSCWDSHANYSSSSAFLMDQIGSAMTYSYSEYPPGHLSYSTGVNPYYNCSTTVLPSVTTLCDGYARASTLSSACQTREETHTFSTPGTYYSFYPTWSTELDQLSSPTCTPATDFGPICTRLKDAYSWRVSHLTTQPSGRVLGPSCRVLNPPISIATPKCHLEGGSWEASYWPKPLPTGSELCGTNGTNLTATPTITSAPKTAIVSGITFTSPSVYHFVRNATLQTFIGRASEIGEPESFGQDLFAPSTTASLLTVKQLEEEILTISRGCSGSGRRRYCYYRASAGFFSVADLVTARADEYCRPFGCWSEETILQDEYTPTAALAMTDIVAQNGVFTDCAWTTPGNRIRTEGPPAWRGPVMRLGDWHKLTATNNEVKETGSPMSLLGKGLA